MNLFKKKEQIDRDLKNYKRKDRKRLKKLWKEWELGNVLKVNLITKENPNKNNLVRIKERENSKEITPFKKSVFEEDYPPKKYKKDLKLFKKANLILENEKERYERGEISYDDLKSKFQFYHSRDYYKRILKKDYGKVS